MVDPRRLSEWMTIISSTEEQEMDCDALVEVAAEVVEAATHGADVREVAPLFALHLEHCPDCADYFSALVAFVESESDEPPRPRP